MKFLDLSHNLIESFTLKSFRYAINLTTLILASNKISYIRERSFKGKLETNVVTSAKINIVVCTGAFNLRFIDLTQNNLQNLNEGLFEFLPTDELTVELWENPINCSCNLKWLSFWIEKVKVMISQVLQIFFKLDTESFSPSLILQYFLLPLAHYNAFYHLHSFLQQKLMKLFMLYS